jgi:hypothetical protein
MCDNAAMAQNFSAFITLEFAGYSGLGQIILARGITEDEIRTGKIHCVHQHSLHSNISDRT